MRQRAWSGCCPSSVANVSNILDLPEGSERELIAPHYDSLMAGRAGLQNVLAKLVSVSRIVLLSKLTDRTACWVNLLHSLSKRKRSSLTLAKLRPGTLS